MRGVLLDKAVRHYAQQHELFAAAAADDMAALAACSPGQLEADPTRLARRRVAMMKSC